ncbi:WG repeat-containing protein [Roseivirga sp. BDSF3-8]|uniref:WG repeat-containing protein n=1 Tax=Roseivirga sp. BDSF3-8 TaxID=3241598 RepID=UPI0035318F3D
MDSDFDNHTTTPFFYYAEDGLYGYIDPKGEVVIPARYSEANAFSEGLALVRQGDKQGFINGRGEWVFSTEFDEIFPFAGGRAVVYKDGLAGYIDTSGKVVIAPQFAEAWSFSEGVAAVQHADGLYGYIDSTGTYVIPPQYAYAEAFSEGLAAIATHSYKDEYGDEVIDSIGYINTSGEIAIPPIYDVADYFHSGRAVVGKGGLNTIIDKQGQPLLPMQEADIKNFDDGISLRITEERQDIIDQNGDQIATLHNMVYGRQFSEGLALVQMENGYSYVNKEGQLLFTPRPYEDAEDFTNGLARVCSGYDAEQKGKCAYIDRLGNYVFKEKYFTEPEG